MRYELDKKQTTLASTLSKRKTWELFFLARNKMEAPSLRDFPGAFGNTHVFVYTTRSVCKTPSPTVDGLPTRVSSILIS